MNNQGSMMWRSVILLAVLFSGMSLNAAVAQQSKDLTVVSKSQGSSNNLYANSWAVLIGVNTFNSPKVPQLQYAVNDVQAVRDILPSLGFLKDKIFTLTNKQATRREIERLLSSKLYKKTKSNDRVLVFFSTHGVTVPLSANREEGFLMPHDGDPDDLPFTAFSMRQLKSIGQRLKARHVLMAIDACFSGYALVKGQARTIIDPRYLELITKSKGIQMLTAGRRNQPVLEDGGFGVFTSKFVQGLRGFADGNGDRLITLTELGAWMHPRVAQASAYKQDMQFGNLDGEGQFVFQLDATEESSAMAKEPSIDLSPYEVLAQQADYQKKLEKAWRAVGSFINAPGFSNDKKLAAVKQFQQDFSKNNPYKEKLVDFINQFKQTSTLKPHSSSPPAQVAKVPTYGDRSPIVKKEKSEKGGVIGAKLISPSSREPSGVKIETILENGPAESGGLKVGDIIQVFKNTKVESVPQFLSLMSEVVTKNPIHLSVWRNDKSLRVTVIPLLGTERVEFFYKGCQSGYAAHCFLLGSLYYDGKMIEKDLKQAVLLYRQVCDGGYSLGCTWLGYFYEKGQGVSKDLQRAVALYRKSCEKGEGEGCLFLGSIYERGEEVTKNLTKAVALYRRSCDAGEAQGCTNLGVMYNNGDGVTKDLAQAVKWFRNGCDAGHVPACINLGISYKYGNGVSKDLSQAVIQYQRGCEGGEARGCYLQGQMYQDGHGVSKDLKQAGALYRMACEGGEVRGCTNLGVRYEKGEGVSKDLSKAAVLYRQGCDGGDARGCYDLGLSYEFGKGVMNDFSQSAMLYRRACEAGLSHGCSKLGVRYFEGEGVTKDVKQAVGLYRKGCDGGNALGCTLLGLMYKFGEGVSKDFKEAVNKFRQGCEGGHGSGCTNLGDSYRHGEGVSKNTSYAKEFYEKGCTLGAKESCDMAKSLD